jgi:hypothetical protein
MATSNKSTGKKSKGPTSSQAATPANRSAQRANAKARKTRDTSGRGYEQPLANYDPITQSWKMCQVISLSGEPKLLERLPKSGMTRNGVLYQQPDWVPIISEKESSSWPTPVSSTGMAEDISTVKARLDEGKPYKSRLIEAVAMWPTPRAAQGQARNYTIYARQSGKPQNLENRIAQREPQAIGGKLNPTWVEWLMGFPIGWTDLED